MAQGAPVGRRVVLGMLGAGVLGTLFGGPLSRTADRLVEAASANGGSPFGGWRYYTVTGGFPRRSAADYRLAIRGLVARPVTLTFADLQRLPRTELVRDFQCVTGWRIPRVRWSGVRLADLLDRVGPLPAARAVAFGSFDGAYTESLTLDQARRPDVLVADTLEAAPISHQHGGPVRLVVAPMYGYKSCKWLGEIRLTAKVETGYWERFGYDVDAWVGRSNGRGDAPTS